MASYLDFAGKNLNTILLPFHKMGGKTFSPTFLISQLFNFFSLGFEFFNFSKEGLVWN